MKKPPHRTPGRATRPPIRLRRDPEQAAAMGLTEEIGVTLPTGWAQLTPEERKAWARHEMEALALETLNDFAAAYGRVVTPEQQARYLEDIQSSLDAALQPKKEK